MKKNGVEILKREVGKSCRKERKSVIRGGWACACVRRGKKSVRFTAIRVNSPEVKRCQVCGMRKPEGGKER